MVNFAQAFIDGGWSGLRDAIKQQDNAMPDYDDSNRIALWPRPDGAKGVYTGGGKTADFDGKEIGSAVMVSREKRSEIGPVGDLFFVTGKGKDARAHYAAIFKNEKGLSGQMEGWWVNVFKNDPDKKGPPYVVKFKAKEGEAAKPAKKAVEQDDDYPPF